MEINVLFFGLLRDVCAATEDRLEIPAGATVGFVFDHYAAVYPQLLAMSSNIVIARNQEFVARDTQLAGGDEVALLPPVSGGSAHEISDSAGHYFALTRNTIEAAALEGSLRQGLDGAIVTFSGVVRNNTKGHATLRLDYECYEAMAIRKMAEIGRAISDEFEISRIAMVHRLGTMEIGETSVVVITTAPHRKAAFDAALEGINRLKRLVPIWKKEYFADGEIWVEGEWDLNAPRAGRS